MKWMTQYKKKKLSKYLYTWSVCLLLTEYWPKIKKKKIFKMKVIVLVYFQGIWIVCWSSKLKKRESKIILCFCSNILFALVLIHTVPFFFFGSRTYTLICSTQVQPHLNQSWNVSTSTFLYSLTGISCLNWIYLFALALSDFCVCFNTSVLPQTYFKVKYKLSHQKKNFSKLLTSGHHLIKIGYLSIRNHLSVHHLGI